MWVVSLSENLKQLRQTSGATLQQVADAVGVSKSNVWDVENGKTKNPTINILIGLASYYRVSIDFLVGNAVCSDNTADLLSAILLKPSSMLCKSEIAQTNPQKKRSSVVFNFPNLKDAHEFHLAIVQLSKMVEVHD